MKIATIGRVTALALSLATLGTAALGCKGGKAPPEHGESAPGQGHQPAGPTAHGPEERAIHEVTAIHGGAGPWAVSGYRMGKFALERLSLQRQSFDLDVTHKSPRSVQFTCIADGASAATGASVGKMNLTMEAADEAHVATTYRHKKTGASVTLRPSAAFVARFRDVPREKLAEAGRVVISLPDPEVFEEVK